MVSKPSPSRFQRREDPSQGVAAREASTGEEAGVVAEHTRVGLAEASSPKSKPPPSSLLLIPQLVPGDAQSQKLQTLLENRQELGHLPTSWQQGTCLQEGSYNRGGRLVHFASRWPTRYYQRVC